MHFEQTFDTGLRMTELSPGKVKVGHHWCYMQNLSLLFLFLGLFLFSPLCHCAFCFWPTTVSHQSGLLPLQTSMEPGRALCTFLGQACPGFVACRVRDAVRGEESGVCKETCCPGPATPDIRWESTGPECPTASLPGGHS